MRARFRRFLFFAFTSSPVCRNFLCHSSIGVKTFRFLFTFEVKTKKWVDVHPKMPAVQAKK